MAKKIIAVAGATGAQGGRVGAELRSRRIRAGGYLAVARGLTRDVNSDKAKALAKAGAEVNVAADVDDVASLRKALSPRRRRVLRHVLLGALLAGAGEGPEALQPGRLAAKAAGDRSTSSGPPSRTRRNSVPLSDTRMPTLQGHYKVPLLRC